MCALSLIATPASAENWVSVSPFYKVDTESLGFDADGLALIDARAYNKDDPAEYFPIALAIDCDRGIFYNDIETDKGWRSHGMSYDGGKLGNAEKQAMLTVCGMFKKRR